MKKLFYLLVTCCVLTPYVMMAENRKETELDAISFFQATYLKTCMFSADTASIIEKKWELILQADSALNAKDTIKVLLKDTTLMQLGLQKDSFVFVIDSICHKDVIMEYDTIDSVFVNIHYLSSTKKDTAIFNVLLKQAEKAIYADAQETQPTSFWKEYKWWLLGSILALLSVGAASVLYLVLLKKRIKHDKDDAYGEENISENAEVRHLRKKINQLEEEQRIIKQKVEEDARKILNDAQKEWEVEKAKLHKAVQDKVTKKEREIENLKEEGKKKLERKDREIAALEEELKCAKDKIKTIRDEVIGEKKKDIDDLTNKLETINKDLRATQTELTSTRVNLENTQARLSDANVKIENLTEAQQQYAEKITFAPYAESYSNKILQLFAIEHNLNEEVIKLSKKGLGDPYHLFKASHRFRIGLADVDMEKFQVEVEMAAKKQMTFTGNGIAHLATLSGEQLSKQVRMYFILNYLTKYINALQIYIESLIGLNKLMDDVTMSDIEPFVQANQQLEKLYVEMKINVICPKLFESIGDNMDLRVELIDAGYESGDILEITNCLVYAADEPKPMDKIFVKAQQ